MKTNFFKTVSVFLLLMMSFSLLSILCSCNRINCPDYKYALGEDSLNIPYDGNEILKFMKVTGSDTDTIVFYGQGKKCFKEVFSFQSEECEEIANCDAREMRYYTKTKDDSILLKIHSLDYQTAFSFYFQFYYKNNQFKVPLRSFKDPATYPDFDLNGKIFNDVFRFYSYDQVGQDVGFVFFNRDNGIIQILFSKEKYSLTKI